MRQPRVMMTADSVGGVFSYAVDLSRGLAARGARVLLAVMGGRLSEAQRASVVGLRGVHVEDSDFALEWQEDPWASVGEAGVWLKALARTFQPDVVHLNGYCHAALSWPCPVVVVAHSCVSSWFEAVKGEPLPPRFATYAREVGRGLAAARCVVAPSTPMAAALVRHHGAPRDLRVIENGIWSDAAPVVPKEPFILAAGRVWDEAKNLRRLAEAAPSLPWPVKVAGEARGTVVPGVEALGVMPRAALAALMTRAAIFVHVPLYEPFGLAPLEAAARGCALVLSRIPTLEELWAGAAEHVPTDDAETLAATLRALSADAARREERAAQALARSRAFDAGRMSRRYLALYQELLVSRPPRLAMTAH